MNSIQQNIAALAALELPNTTVADSFIRYFIIPGKAHSAEGNGENTLGGTLANLAAELEILRAWREKGIAPAPLTGKLVADGKVRCSFEIPKYIPGSVKYPPACDDEYLDI